MTAAHLPAYTEADAAAPAVFWPALTPGEARLEWDALHEWVCRLQSRFPRSTALPACWYRHNDIVELLAALRDYERHCFGPAAPATAAFDWHRAHREAEDRVHGWVQRLRCSVSTAAHDEQPAAQRPGPEFEAFVASDVAARRQGAAQRARGAAPAGW